MALKETLMKLISKDASPIKDSKFDLDETSGGKVGGFIISATFVGMSQIERQNMLWDYLDDNLGKEEILHIVSLVTVTPDEDEED